MSVPESGAGAAVPGGGVPEAQEAGDRVLAGFAGFGSFMQDTSVQTLVTQHADEYTVPQIAVSSDPLEHGFEVRSNARPPASPPPTPSLAARCCRALMCGHRLRTGNRCVWERTAM